MRGVPFAKTYTRTCPGPPKRHLRLWKNPNDALHMYVPTHQAHLTVDPTTLKVGAGYISGVQGLLQGLDKSVQGLVTRFQMAYA